MKKMRKNNKGFSLVELIVVILIMAIIAVALAPQVMKWVDQSKVSTDNSNKAILKSAMDAAVADYLSEGNSFSGNVVIVYTTNEEKATRNIITDGSGFEAYIDRVLDESQSPVVKQYDPGHFKVVITDKGAVTVTIDSGSGT